jgi:nucleoside-diphosphate-sugar epimerase
VDKENTHPILIAGCGYVGSQLARILESRGQKIIPLSLSGHSAERIQSEVTSCDLSDPDAVAQLAKSIRKPASIVHCASSNRGGPDAYRAVYFRGVVNLISAFPNSQLLFTSSTSVYAQIDGSSVDEDSPAEPASETARILKETEDIVLENAGTVLRLSGIYGPGRCIYIQRLLDHTATIESGSPSRYLNQIHRDDAAAAIDHLMRQSGEEISGEIYNVTDGHSPTQRECYENLADFFDLPIPPESPTAENSKRARTHRRLSNAKLSNTGWHPVYSTLLDAVRNDAALIPSFT